MILSLSNQSIKRLRESWERLRNKDDLYVNMEICTVHVPLRIQSSLKKRKEKGVTKRLIRLISRGWAYQTSLHKYFIRKGAKQKIDLC
jgi:hypothetical protein